MSNSSVTSIQESRGVSFGSTFPEQCLNRKEHLREIYDLSDEALIQMLINDEWSRLEDGTRLIPIPPFLTHERTAS
jgi:hypothetical protein